MKETKDISYYVDLNANPCGRGGGPMPDEEPEMDEAPIQAKTKAESETAEKK